MPGLIWQMLAIFEQDLKRSTIDEVRCYVAAIKEKWATTSMLSMITRPTSHQASEYHVSIIHSSILQNMARLLCKYSNINIVGHPIWCAGLAFESSCRSACPCLSKVCPIFLVHFVDRLLLFCSTEHFHFSASICVCLCLDAFTQALKPASSCNSQWLVFYLH